MAFSRICNAACCRRWQRVLWKHGDTWLRAPLAEGMEPGWREGQRGWWAAPHGPRPGQLAMIEATMSSMRSVDFSLGA
jgi:hypothetical protein